MISTETLLSIISELEEATTASEVGRAAAEACVRVCDADVAGILVLDDRVLRPLATAGSAAGPGFREYRAGLDGRSLFTQALGEEGTLTSADLLKDPRGSRRVSDLLGIRALAVTRLSGARGPQGVLFAGRVTPETGGEVEGAAELEAVAGLVALALDRARLVAEVRRTSRAADDHARQLRARGEELERLIFLLSHDLRTPVVSIQNFLHYLDTEVGDELPEEARFYLDRIGANCEHLNNLIRGILDLTQVGRDDRERERVDLADVLDEVLATLEPEIREAEAEVDVRELPEVMGHRTRLFQVFQNLLGNALAYGDAAEDAPLRIRVTSEEDDEGMVRIRVSNDGPPIPENARGEVFDLFRRLPSAVERKPEGTGAGLAIVKRIVTAHDGDVGVETVDGGPSFWLTLPGAR